MSLTGSATANKVLRGRINRLDTLVVNAYEVAVINGFEGTEEEWLASLEGPPGPRGTNGVHVGTEPPADESINVWINPDETGEEADMLIPDALPNPEKLTFTGVPAEYDGSAPVSVRIPTKTSDLKNDSGYVTSVPGALPNPHKLTFTGAVTGEYDGSQAVTVALPKTMVVTLTHSNGVYTADTTYDEISEAYEAGQEVRCNYQDMLLPLVQYSSFFVIFACVYGTRLYSVLIKATDNSVTMTVTDASATGDADLSGYIPAPETAAVGQTVVVKAVDENGKPTQWEAVDLAGGGGYGWQLLTTVTTTENVTSLTVNTGDDGVMFEDKQLTELTAFFEIPGNADLTSTANLIVTCGWHVQDTQAAAIPNVLSSKKQYARVHCKACGDGALMWFNPPAGAPVHMSVAYGPHPFSVIPQIHFYSTASDIPIPTGTVIKVYGR